MTEKEPMEPETLEALKGSIVKWKRIVRSTKEKDRGGMNCPLCQMHNIFDAGCSGCPVKTHTGENYCRTTPYLDWSEHQNQEHDRFGVLWHRVPHCKECLSLAREEVAFLENLLPKEK